MGRSVWLKMMWESPVVWGIGKEDLDPRLGCCIVCGAQNRSEGFTKGMDEVVRLDPGVGYGKSVCRVG